MPYAFRIEPGSKVKLSAYDPGHHDGMEKDAAERKTLELGQELTDLQELMYASGQNSLLIVLQGRDTSGKDGSIKRLLHYLNALSCRVIPFKQPTEVEMDHDFLWRIHAETPRLGWTAIFNRSHYEDVLVVRVHDLVPKGVWKGRYEHINQFEELLHDAGTIVLKFYLHISKDEQEQRLMAREEDPDKAYKLAVGDWKERELWGDYTEAYEDALGKCSPDHAPWFVVPANHKWFRDLAILETLVHALRPFKDGWKDSLKERGIRERAELEAFRASRGKQ